MGTLQLAGNSALLAGRDHQRLLTSTSAHLRGQSTVLESFQLRAAQLFEHSTQPAAPSNFCGTVEFNGGSGCVSFNKSNSSPAEEAFPAPVPGQLKNKWQAWTLEARRLQGRLRAYGVAGLLAYGLLNTLYYSGAFLILWLYFAKVPRGLGWAGASRQFATVMSLTWAASQVSKVPRAALALLLAPTADGILIFLQARLRLRTRRNAFLLVVGLCVGIAAAVFGITVAVWA